MKFYCQTLHNHWDVSKYYTPPPPLKSLSTEYFVQMNTRIVVQWIAMPTNDVKMNVKILLHIFPCLQDILKDFCIIV